MDLQTLLFIAGLIPFAFVIALMWLVHITLNPMRGGE